MRNDHVTHSFLLTYHVHIKKMISSVLEARTYCWVSQSGLGQEGFACYSFTWVGTISKQMTEIANVKNTLLINADSVNILLP